MTGGRGADRYVLYFSFRTDAQRQGRTRPAPDVSYSQHRAGIQRTLTAKISDGNIEVCDLPCGARFFLRVNGIHQKERQAKYGE
jgi:hypothetical protein